MSSYPAVDPISTASVGEEAVHAVGPIVIVGPAGSGITGCLAQRAIRLVRDGALPDAVLLLGSSAATAAALRLQLRRCVESAASHAPERELEVATVEAICEQLLRGFAAEAGVDPFFVVATKGERMRMLLEYVRTLAPAAQDGREAVSPVSVRTPSAMLRMIERIDWLKSESVDAERYASLAAGKPRDASGRAGGAAVLAELYGRHERLLAAMGALDEGDLLLRASSLLDANPESRDALRERYVALLLDDFQGSRHSWVSVVGHLAASIDDHTIGGYGHELADFAAGLPEVRTLRLQRSVRCAPRVLSAAEAVLATSPAQQAGAMSMPGLGTSATSGRDESASWSADMGTAASGLVFWQCPDERAQAVVLAGDIRRARANAPEASVCVLVRSLQRDARALVSEFKARAIAYRIHCAPELFERAEVRDLVAWIRLLGDPLDTEAAVRLLGRPPTELRPGELARVIQLAKRRKLDLISTLEPALQMPELPPEARERIRAFSDLHGELAGGLAEMHPQQLVHTVAERTGLRRAALADLRASRTESSGVDALAGFGDLEDLAAHFAELVPGADALQFVAYLTDVMAAGLPLHRGSVHGSPTSPWLWDPAAAVSPPVHLAGARLAAGHEFDYVYVLGGGAVARLDSPRRPGGDRAGMRDGAGLPDHAAWAELVDGRRLYVALTRARKRVTVLGIAGADSPGRLVPPGIERACQASGGEWEHPPAESLGESDALHAALRVQRERVLADVRLIGGRLGELRLDTDRDIATGVVRYLELVKLAALAERPREQTLSEALGEVNARLLGAVTPLERELFAASDLDESLTTVQPGRDISPAGSDGEDPRLAALLPRRGEGILLSASDIETYRACPLRYKYARVLRIPSDPTPQQRFGIMVHKVLERYHAGLDSGTAKTSDEPTAAGARPLSVLMGLLDSGWRRAGFGATDGEVALLAKAREALTTYHQQLADQPGEPVWFERQFSFAVGPHVVRGRVDRVDRLPDGDYELIDYKTGYPKAQAELETDIQLSLYALAAERAWNVRATRQAYYYVLDNRKVSLTDSGAASRRQLITDAIGEVGAGVAAMRLDPTPSFAACSHCDYLNICPAAEA